MTFLIFVIIGYELFKRYEINIDSLYDFHILEPKQKLEKYVYIINIVINILNIINNQIIKLKKIIDYILILLKNI